MMDMMYAKREEDGTGRRESLTNIQDIASRISSLQDKENVDNNMRMPIEINSGASVKVNDILSKPVHINFYRIIHCYYSTINLFLMITFI